MLSVIVRGTTIDDVAGTKRRKSETLGVAQLTSSRNGITDDQISEVLRCGRFEDLALIAVIACFAMVAALAVAMQLGAPQNILFPVMAVVFAILFLAMGAW